MRQGKIGILRQAMRRLRNTLLPRAIILLYHRVTEVPSDPQLLAVTPQHFAEHLEILRKWARPMRLQQLAGGFGCGNLSRRSVVVTFDDGYADNLHNAKSLLEHYDIPATVFVTGGYVGQEREFWWDELERLLLQPGTLPETLDLSLNGTSYRWDLGEASHYSVDSFQSLCGWNVLSDTDPGPRQHLYRTLHQLLQSLPPGEQAHILAELWRWSGAAATGRSSHRALTVDELRELARGGLVEIGAHTVNHPVLSLLPEASQRDEIKRSKGHLEEILEHSVNSFSYPYGSDAAYTSETVDIVRDLGFTCACANYSNLVRPGVDRYQLPRLLVRDWDGETFARRLEGWWRD